MANILVVDDELQIREMLRKMLEMEGHDVITASDGRAAIRLVQQRHVDLIITDIIMPDEDGLGVLMKLKEHSPEIKTIAISGGGRIGPQDYLKMAKGLGAHRVFSKPVEREEMLNAIKELLG
jgi:CheY-like chemotaxis protein